MKFYWLITFGTGYEYPDDTNEISAFANAQSARRIIQLFWKIKRKKKY